MDTTYPFFADDRGNVWFKTTNVPGWKIDGYNYTIIGTGDTVKRVVNGVMRAEELSIYPNGTDQSTRINSAIAMPYVRAIRFASDSARAFTVTGNVNAKGKTFIFENGTNLTGNATIDSVVVQKNDYDKIFDTTLTFTNLKSVDGYITPQNFGAKGDSISNDVRYIQRAITVGADNKLKTLLPDGTYYINGKLVLKTNTNLSGSNNTILKIDNGSNINYGNAIANNVKIQNLTILMRQSGQSSALLSPYSSNTADTSFNFELSNITIDANRCGYHLIMPSRLKRVRITNVNISNSDNSSIFLTDCQDVLINNIHIKNSGRAGICMYKRVYDFDIGNVWVDGFAQYSGPGDGAIDCYGGQIANGIIHDAFITTDTMSAGGGLFHNPVRICGAENIQVKNIHITSNSKHLDHAIRVSLRDTFYSRNISLDNISIRIKDSSYFNNVIFFQGVEDFSVSNITITIDSGAIRRGAPSIFGIYTEGGPNKYVTSAIFKNNKVNFNGLAADFFVNTAKIHYVSMDNNIIENTSTRIFVPLSDTVKSFLWNGGKIISKYNAGFPMITVPEKTKLFTITNVTATYVTNKFITSSNNTTVIISNNNYLNGLRDNTTWGGGGFLDNNSITATTDSISNFAGFINTAKTNGNQTIILTTPLNTVNNKRQIVIGRFVTSGYTTTITNVYGGDVVINDNESASFYNDGTNWYRLFKGTSGNSGSGGGAFIDNF